MVLQQNGHPSHHPHHTTTTVHPGFRPHTFSRAGGQSASAWSMVATAQRGSLFCAPLRPLKWTGVTFLSLSETTESTVAPPRPAPVLLDLRNSAYEEGLHLCTSNKDDDATTRMSATHSGVGLHCIAALLLFISSSPHRRTLLALLHAVDEALCSMTSRTDPSPTPAARRAALADAVMER
jgi:hypothetical protein